LGFGTRNNNEMRKEVSEGRVFLESDQSRPIGVVTSGERMDRRERNRSVPSLAARAIRGTEDRAHLGHLPRASNPRDQIRCP
jgi:hypothetical protein